MSDLPFTGDRAIRRRILVVDDDRDFAEGLDIKLSTEAYDVRVASHAAGALECLEDFAADVALIDVRLAGSSGINLIANLTRARPTIICVMMTAYAELGSAIDALRHGAHNYLVKPLNSDELLATLENCFEKIRLEEQLRQAQKREAIGQLTGGIAHDFNNLLTIISGSLELLAHRADRDERLIELVDRARRASQRGAELTQRLLAFSRNQPLDPKVMSLNQCIAGMMDLLRSTLAESIELETRFKEDLGHCVADPMQVENALINLAVNARDAMPKGGRLVIETANVTFDGSGKADGLEVAPGRYVGFSVTDTGSGMTTETIEHVFDPFFTTKETGRGSGLGLSMVYGFVRQSGGHIAIDSDPGHGTIVTVYFPEASSGEPLWEAPTPLHEMPGGSETILVVEDDDDVRALALTLLGDLGYRVLAAQDGPAALKLLDDDAKVDLMFTDMVLPGGMNGHDIAVKVAQRRPEIGTLYTSGYAEQATSGTGTSTTGATLLRKPYRKAELAHIVRKVLDANAARQASSYPVPKR